MVIYEKLRALLKGSAIKYLLIACLVILGVLTAVAVVMAVFRGTFGENGYFASTEEIPISGEWKLMRVDTMEFSETAFDDSDWEVVSLPANTADDNGNPNAIQWLRKRVFVPLNERGAYNAISLGTIHAADEVFFNRVLIGSTGSMTDEWDINYDKARIYTLPADIIVLDGWSVVAVRTRPIFPDIAGIYKGSLAIGDQIGFTSGVIMRDIPLVIAIFVLLFSGIIFMFLSIVRSRREVSIGHL